MRCQRPDEGEQQADAGRDTDVDPEAADEEHPDFRRRPHGAFGVAREEIRGEPA
jgi:hypothetical protein